MLSSSFSRSNPWVLDFLVGVDRAEVFQVSRIRASAAYVEDFGARLGQMPNVAVLAQSCEMSALMHSLGYR